MRAWILSHDRTLGFGLNCSPLRIRAYSLHTWNINQPTNPSIFNQMSYLYVITQTHTRVVGDVVESWSWFFVGCAKSEPLKIQSEHSVEVNGIDQTSGTIVNRLRLRQTSVDAIVSNHLSVRGANGKLLFLADRDNVIVASDKLRINSEY